MENFNREQNNQEIQDLDEDFINTTPEKNALENVSVENPIEQEKEPVVEKKPASTRPDYEQLEKEGMDMFTNAKGERVDFRDAKDYHQLIEMVSQEGVIVNQLGTRLPAETVINLIYKLTYQDLNNFQKEDWTNITLRHGLREAVADLISKYKKSDEFKSLVGLDLSGARDIDELKELLAIRGELIDATGQPLSADRAIEYINRGYLSFLPEPIRFKVIEINKQSIDDSTQVEEKTEQKKSWFGRTISKLKFW